MTECEGGVTIAVRVTPRASQDAVGGEHGGALKVRLVAPAIEDRANESLRRILAARLKVPMAAVRIVAGEKNRSKRVRIAGVTREQLLALVIVGGAGS
ncbi:MAG: DUF167 domain-containing protein [Candidatus Acidiferrales bacterium]